MLTYNDCLGLSELNQEEVSALARIKHLPEVVALEMGWNLCRTPEGAGTIRRMILDDIEAACRHGDTRTAAKLGLVLHHFLEGHHAPDTPAEPRADGDHLAGALRLGRMAARWARESVDTYMAAALHHFGLDRASARERFPTRMQAAELCCATCAGTRRCRRFLAGAVGPRRRRPSARTRRSSLSSDRATRAPIRATPGEPGTGRPTKLLAKTGG